MEIEKILNISDDNSLLESRNIKKQVEWRLGIPRTRIYDCSRLIFSENYSGYLRIDKIRQIYPNYNLPKLKKKTYNIQIILPNISGTWNLKINNTGYIEDFVFQICNGISEIYNSLNLNKEDLKNLFLYNIYLKKNGNGWLNIEYINQKV